jgi:hypothetical protein
MREYLTIAVALAASLCLAACGTVGDPMFPARYVPNPVTNLAVVERGPNLIASFTIPPLTTEGLALKEITSVDLRIAEGVSDPAQWEATSRAISVTPPQAPTSLSVPIPVANLVGKDVVVGVRIGGRKDRFSKWSNLVTLRVEPPLDRPSAVSAKAVPAGVELRWQGGNAGIWKIFRTRAGEQAPSLLAEVKKPEYLDETTTFGTSYSYLVQAERGKVESDASEAVAIKPEDTFPPSPPLGFAASVGTSTIELTWLRSAEPDFKEYRVYRTNPEGAFEVIASGLTAPAYSDTKVESGKRYRYAVAAVDQAGNVSERSAPVEITAP